MGDRLIIPISSSMTYSRMRALVKSLDVTVSSCQLPRGVDGYYDESTKVILIDYRCTYAQKRCALVHELLHWSHADSECAPHIDSRAENRARRQTAQLLVDPFEYANLETVYEGDIFSIAADFEVTVQTVQDFQENLRLGFQLSTSPRE